MILGSFVFVVEKVFLSYGELNGYIFGEEGFGVFVVGVWYGEGELYICNVGIYKVFW